MAATSLRDAVAVDQPDAEVGETGIDSSFSDAHSSDIMGTDSMGSGPPDSDRVKLQVAMLALDRFTVLGEPERAEKTPGSAYYIDKEELERMEYADALRVLRGVPGLYIQEEEGYGLRPNIGIRGSGLDRSARILLMEDGVMIAPAPYAAPSAYYFPTMQRMFGVEVLKGPAAIKQGPRTTGGAINFLSTPLPEPASAAGNVLFLAGDNSTFQGWANYGYAGDQFAILGEIVKQNTSGFKELDGGGDTGYDLDDGMLKLRWNSKPGAGFENIFEFKLGHTKQVGNETYLGLTDEDFNANHLRRYSASQLDEIVTDHDLYQLSWQGRPANADWDVGIKLYRTDFYRNWYKLQSVGGAGIGTILANPDDFEDELAWIRGEDSPDGMLSIRANKREYYGQGLQSFVGIPFVWGSTEHNLELGFRYHRDEEDRFQHEDDFRMENGTLVLTSSGLPGSQSNRVSTGETHSFYAEDVIDIGDWSITAGLRFENMDLERRDYSTADPDRSEGPTQARSDDLDVTIPGLGMTWQASPRWLLLAGLFKGYNPPAPGSGAKEEESTNLEIGARYRTGNGSSMDAIFFFNDYENLVGTCTASTGGDCEIGDQFDGGEVEVYGLELVLAHQFLSRRSVQLPVRLAYTWTQTGFQNSFESDFDPWGDVVAGDELPYIPENQFQLSAGLTGMRWAAWVVGNYADATRTIAGSGAIPAGEGTDDFFVIDISGEYQLNDRAQLFGRIDNLFDQEYIVARRPAGARPGKPRSFLAGVRVAF